MAVVAKKAWERQQQRARAIEEASRLPALSHSKLLSLASQMNVFLQQLNSPHTSATEDANYFQNIIRANSSKDESDISGALAVGMLMQAWGANAEDGSDDELGSWNAWKSSPGKDILLSTSFELVHRFFKSEFLNFSLTCQSCIFNLFALII